MKKVHPLTAVVTGLSIILTAQWFVRRERSLVGKFLSAIGR